METQDAKTPLSQSSDAKDGLRFKRVPLSEAFPFSYKLEMGASNELELTNVSDSDHIHNHKKMDNHLDYVMRDLRPGPY